MSRWKHVPLFLSNAALSRKAISLAKDSPAFRFSHPALPLSYPLTCLPAAGRDTWTAGEFCSVTALADIALKLDYFRVAGAVAFAFVLFALILVATANWFANMRRRDELDQRIHVRLGGLKSPLLPLILYACAMFCAVIAWTSYIGIIQSNFNAADFQRAMLAAGPWRYSRYGEGFGLAILATLTLLPTMLVFTLFRNEVNKDVAKEEAAGAQQQAQFSGTAGAYPGAYTDGACVQSQAEERTEAFDCEVRISTVSLIHCYIHCDNSLTLLQAHRSRITLTRQVTSTRVRQVAVAAHILTPT